jgi:putative IMPACT (imprinted ancient) family translation regulator
VKLGVRGLISAYKIATENVLAKAQVTEKLVTERLTLSFDYEATSQIRPLLRRLDVKILEQDFGVRTNLVLDISVHQKEKIISQLELIKALGKAIDWQFES